MIEDYDDKRQTQHQGRLSFAEFEKVNYLLQVKFIFFKETSIVTREIACVYDLCLIFCIFYIVYEITKAFVSAKCI